MLAPGSVTNIAMSWTQDHMAKTETSFHGSKKMSGFRDATFIAA